MRYHQLSVQSAVRQIGHLINARAAGQVREIGIVLSTLGLGVQLGVGWTVVGQRVGLIVNAQILLQLPAAG